jgi:hypothetical protein
VDIITTVEANGAAPPLEPLGGGPDKEKISSTGTGKKGGKGSAKGKGKSRHLIDGRGIVPKGGVGASDVPAESNGVAPPQPLEGGPEVPAVPNGAAPPQPLKGAPDADVPAVSNGAAPPEPLVGAPGVPAVPNGAAPLEPPEGAPEVELLSTGKKDGGPNGSRNGPTL